MSYYLYVNERQSYMINHPVLIMPCMCTEWFEALVQQLTMFGRSLGMENVNKVFFPPRFTTIYELWLFKLMSLLLLLLPIFTKWKPFVWMYLLNFLFVNKESYCTLCSIFEKLSLQSTSFWVIFSLCGGIYLWNDHSDTKQHQCKTS